MYNQHEFLKDSVDLFFLSGLRNPFQFIRGFFNLYNLAKNYSVVHAQYGSAVGWITSFLPTKRVLSLKGSDWYSSPPNSFLDKLRISLGLFLTRNSLKRYHAIIVMSERMKSDVLKYKGDLNVYTLVDPIDLDRFIPEKLSKKDSSRNILFAAVNTQNPLKRFSLAKQAVDILKNRLDGVKFHVMSGLPHEKVPAFMKQMDVILLTSTHEGWPNVIKEMLALNKPFVATDVSDLKCIAELEPNCFVCPPDEKSLSEALEKALSLPKQNLRRHVIPFSMKNYYGNLFEIYSSVI